jgi:hypothetical protein
METLDQNANRPQSPARPPEPLNAFVQAVHRGYIRLGLDGAHPRQVTGVSLMDDDGEIVRLHRLELER